MITDETKARDRAETTEGITEAVLELLLLKHFDYSGGKGNGQAEREDELEVRCKAWLQTRYAPPLELKYWAPTS